MPFATPTNITGIPEMLGYIDSTTSNYFIPLILFAVWFIIFIFINQKSSEDTLSAFIISGFLGTILSIILRVITPFNPTIIILFILITSISVGIKTFT
jgi:hypothetical protein